MLARLCQGGRRATSHVDGCWKGRRTAGKKTHLGFTGTDGAWDHGRTGPPTTQHNQSRRPRSNCSLRARERGGAITRVSAVWHPLSSFVSIPHLFAILIRFASAMSSLPPWPASASAFASAASSSVRPPRPRRHFAAGSSASTIAMISASVMSVSSSGRAAAVRQTGNFTAVTA